MVLNSDYYPPVYDSPRMMQPMLAPMRIEATETKRRGTKCPVCGHVGPSNRRFVMGNAAWFWVIFLFITTVILGVLPFFVNYWKDIEYVCDRCGAVKDVKLAKIL